MFTENEVGVTVFQRCLVWFDHKNGPYSMVYPMSKDRAELVFGDDPWFLCASHNLDYKPPVAIAFEQEQALGCAPDDLVALAQAVAVELDGCYPGPADEPAADTDDITLWLETIEIEPWFNLADLAMDYWVHAQGQP